MKFFSYMIVAVISFCLAIFAVNNFSDGTSFDFSSQEPVPTQQESTSFTTYYDQLTDFEKALYNATLSAVQNADKEFKLTNVDIEAFQKSTGTVGRAVQYDHPEYFWFTGGYSYSFTRFQDVGTVKVEPIYYSYVSDFFKAGSKQSQLEKAVKEVAEKAKKHSTDDYERILFVHDYLVEHAIYDHDGLKEYYTANKSPSCEYIFAAYGCLVNGKTVCSGFAKAFQLIMHEMGYDCTYVVGEAGEAHGWNCIYLDGEGYFIDVTWDNADFEKGEVPLYNYAFITSETLEKTHTVDMPFETPVCTATEYDFFLRKGYYLEKYNHNAVKEILEKQKDNKGAYIQFGSRAELGKAVKAFSSKAYKKSLGLENAYYVTYNEDHHTLSILLEQ